MPAATSKADQTRDYLQSISQHEILGEEAEIKYGRQARRRATCLDIKKTVAKEVQEKLLKTRSSISSDEYEKMYLDRLSQALGEGEQLSMADVEKIVRIGDRARDRLIRSNMKLVVSVAKKYQGRGLALNDLCQEGAIGLARAADKFDERRGYRFSTYAYWWIRQGVTRAIAQQSRTIRLPIHVTEKLNKLKKAHRLASQKDEHLPIEDVEKILGVKPGGAAEFLSRTARPWSLSHQIVGGRSGDRDTELIEFVASDTVEPEDSVFQNDLISTVRDEIARRLGKREAEIIVRRMQGESLESIGKSMHVTRERVRQLEKNAKYKLRNSFILREAAQSLSA